MWYTRIVDGLLAPSHFQLKPWRRRKITIAEEAQGGSVEKAVPGRQVCFFFRFGAAL